MVLVCQCIARPLHLPALREMFEDRKRVFVDLLKWDVPVLEGRYELDQFDGERAVYLIAADAERGHAASARLLPTSEPHILDTLFPELCAAPPPRGGNVYEITRFCLADRQGAAARLEARNRLVSALVRHALDNGIRTYVGVAEMRWLQQILAFGWRCRPLGLPRPIGGRLLGALAIEIDEETPALLEASGIYSAEPLHPLEILEAA
ncbi:MAG TPA: acyl-homoserine-lactone synthase [Allosphingosinicella sp.]|nr:acyl-homoserine-lactone synthase [Allosphingosinicella sp.]